MSQRTHPKILRIRETKDWLSRGFYQKNFSQYLEEDFQVRKFLAKKLPQASVQDVEIERSPTRLTILIKTSRPALIIGRGGRGVEELKDGLERIFEKMKKHSRQPKREIKIEILEVRNPWLSANLVAQWVAGQLEKMVRYRKALKISLSRIMEQKEVQGARIEVSGRLDGVKISRTEWLKNGKLPRQTLRAVIDYGFSEAHCSFGLIGVKVWIYKGEKFE